MASSVTCASRSMRKISRGVFMLLSVLVSGLKRIHELVPPGRQDELKHGASRFIGLCPQPASMGIYNGPADRQPHSNSIGLRGVEGLENALEMRRINARPGIAHGHEDATCLVLVGADQQLACPRFD